MKQQLLPASHSFNLVWQELATPELHDRSHRVGRRHEDHICLKSEVTIRGEHAEIFERWAFSPVAVAPDLLPGTAAKTQ